MDWLLFFAFIPLLIADNQRFRENVQRSHSRFYPAFVAFLLWNLSSTWWISYASISGMVFIVVLNALLMAVVWWLANLVRNRFQELTGFFALVVYWLCFEFLLHHCAIPWPWLALGNGFAHSVKIIQWYEFTGVLGGSMWILVSNILGFLAVQYLSGKLLLKSLKYIILYLSVVFLPIFWSVNSYNHHTEKGTSVQVMVLQPNVDPYTEKFAGISPEKQLKKLMLLLESQITDSTDLILAPETALPVLWEDSLQNQSVHSISELIDRFPNASFMAGALTQRKFNTGEIVSETARHLEGGDFYYDIYNSALFFDSTKNVQVSHKSILVNGVERMPFQKYFSFMGEFILNLGGTTGSLAAADSIVMFSGSDSLKIGAAICFESAFGEYTGNLVKKGAGLLVVMTNDGWWKDSPGIWQHFGYSSIRAIENRRSIAQSANTGISGFINQRGEVLEKTGINTPAAIESKLWVNKELTYYTLNGDYIGRICTLFSVVLLLLLIAGKKIW
jgi:apolipoprotein N-acyltransferase